MEHLPWHLYSCTYTCLPFLLPMPGLPISHLLPAHSVLLWLSQNYHGALERQLFSSLIWCFLVPFLLKSPASVLEARWKGARSPPCPGCHQISGAALLQGDVATSCNTGVALHGFGQRSAFPLPFGSPHLLAQHGFGGCAVTIF